MTIERTEGFVLFV